MSVHQRDGLDVAAARPPLLCHAEQSRILGRPPFARRCRRHCKPFESSPTSLQFAVATVRYRMFLPVIAVFVVDLIISGVAFAHFFFKYFLANIDATVSRERQEEKTMSQTQLLTLAGVVLFKSYEFVCSRRLFWFLQWQFDARAVPVSALVKDGDEFQL